MKRPGPSTLFAEIDRSPPALKSTIVQTPPTLAVGIRSFAVQILYQYYDKNAPHGLGPTRVPPGETFTREPGGNGAQIQSNLQGSP